jgi:ubiquinone biosynthesis protein COQ9
MSSTDWAGDAEQKILDAALGLAAEAGWSGDLAARAGAVLGFSRGETELLLPNGARDLAALLSRRHDQAALAALEALDPAALKIRERIRAGVLARLDAAMGDEAAVRRAVGFLALPLNAPLALRLAWESADAIWRWAGDTATDENHYTKRAILAGVLTSTLAVELAKGRDEALTYLDARIQNVMDFEKWKAGIHPSQAVERVAGLLARLRYGRRAEPAD